MAQRTVALFNGKYIGIETIFTVIDGKQINIPEKVEELRRKSQRNELFCPCGCGANLVLVAGDKNLREQHFRIKDGQYYENCTITTEGKTSIDSKIVLKCWLDDNLHDENLESRVPICDVSESDRKYEFTFLSRKNGIAVDYCHNRAFLTDEKQNMLEQNSSGITIIHIVDYMNGGSNGQYPEGMIKIQKKQRYCLLLSVRDADYDTAKMLAVFYAQDLYGLWNEIVFADGLLKEYHITEQGQILFHGSSLDERFLDSSTKFQNELEDEKKRIEAERIRREEQRWQAQLEAERREKEEQKRREERLEQLKKQKEEAAGKQAEFEERRRLEDQRREEERRQMIEAMQQEIPSRLDQQDEQVIDYLGNRWIKCEYCGKAATADQFISYGGAIGVHLNLGKCKECAYHNPAAQELKIETRESREQKQDPTICPLCGEKLILKHGMYGSFWGCSTFPKCHYTRTAK